MSVTVIALYDQPVTRWGPDARGRLAEAAMELYGERGFDETTVAEIARRAGLTERTFFRHFADKREVLFAGSNQLREFLVNSVSQAPASDSPMGAVSAAVEALGQVFLDRDFSRRRQAIISANAELQERELIKLASLASAIAAALRRRGAPEPTASLAAETGIAVFKITFERWIDAGNRKEWKDLIREALNELKVLMRVDAL
jgi:AcrR family transcriptional regulator